jgi:5'-methylthioadenosine phosphorylase
MAPTAEIGVFGGSGFYQLLDDVEEVTIETPYGLPSAPVTIGEAAGRPVAFIPRHGTRHELPPHRINYRANVSAMREVGVRRILGPAAVGALRPDLELGELVVCDQFVDRTRGRVDTFYDGGDEPATHVSSADPFCPDLRRLVIETAAELGVPARDRGTVVVIQGPRFSTRAESAWFQAAGWDVINMTLYPEAHLARELELCYAAIAMVTDYDVGVREGHGAVSSGEAVAVFERNLACLRELLFAVLPQIPPQPAEHLCATALRGAQLGA